MVEPNRDDKRMLREVEVKEKRRLKADQRKGEVWFGFGMFGMIGWAVSVPTVAMTFLGIWLDRTRPQTFSWTLMLLLIGLMMGCANAWFWVQRERGDILREREEDMSDSDSEDKS